jgi:hypothetical protein
VIVLMKFFHNPNLVFSWEGLLWLNECFHPFVILLSTILTMVKTFEINWLLNLINFLRYYQYILIYINLTIFF